MEKVTYGLYQSPRGDEMQRLTGLILRDVGESISPRVGMRCNSNIVNATEFMIRISPRVGMRCN